MYSQIWISQKTHSPDPMDRIMEDRLSGAGADRPGLKSALDYARPGDVLVVGRLDRLSRSLKDLIEMIALLESKGVGLKSLQESIDTSSSSGKLVFHIFGAFHCPFSETPFPLGLIFSIIS